MRTLEIRRVAARWPVGRCGLRALGVDDDVLVVVTSVDAPGVAGLCPPLLDPPLGPESEAHRGRR